MFNTSRLKIHKEIYNICRKWTDRISGNKSIVEIFQRPTTYQLADKTFLFTIRYNRSGDPGRHKTLLNNGPDAITIPFF